MMMMDIKMKANCEGALIMMTIDGGWMMMDDNG